MLERLYVDNYRCITGLDVRLAPSQLVVGCNGCGKTSLWEIIAALQDVVARGQSVEDAFPETTRTRWDNRSVQAVELDARIDTVSFRYRLEIDHPRSARGGVRTVIAGEKLTADDRILYDRGLDGTVELFGDDQPSASPRPRIPFDTRRSFLPSLQERPDNGRLRCFRDYLDRMVLVGNVGCTAFEVDSTGEAERLSRSAANLGSWLRSRFQDAPGVVAAIEADLRRCMPGFRGMRFEKTGRETRTFVVDAAPAGGTPYSLALNELSDGERVLLAAYALLHAAEAGTFFFLDEPDNFLAPGELQPWLAKFRETVRGGGGQLVIASHHAETIDYLAAADVLVLARPAGGPARVGSLDFDRASGMKASEWLASVTGGN